MNTDSIGADKKYDIYKFIEGGKSKGSSKEQLLIRSGETALGHCTLLVISDGIGEDSKATEASRAVIDKLSRWWSIDLRTIAGSHVLNVKYLISESLNASLNSINFELYENAAREGHAAGASTIILFMLEDWYTIKHAGQCRIYKMARNLHQLTEEHNMLNEHLKRKGHLDNAEDYSRLLSTVTNYLGIKPVADLFEQCGRVSEADSFLLCSDGFYNYISKVEMMKGLKNHWKTSTERRESMRKLLQKARSRGADEEISVIFITRKARMLSMRMKANQLLRRGMQP